MSENTFHITACDNELIFIAYKWQASYEILRMYSGNSQSVDVTVPVTAGELPNTITLNGVQRALSGTYPTDLPAGEYKLAVMGINWGAAQQFQFTFNDKTYELPYSSEPPKEGSGFVWTVAPAIDFTVS